MAYCPCLKLPGGSEHCILLALVPAGLNQLVLVLGAICNATMIAKLCS